MERVTKLWMVVAVAMAPFVAWRISLFYELSITQAQYEFLDYDAQIIFSLATILMFTAYFDLRSRIEHE